MENNPKQPPYLKDTLMRLPAVLNAVGVSKSTWWSWVAEGYAPEALHLGKRTTVWRASDVQHFIDTAPQMKA